MKAFNPETTPATATGNIQTREPGADTEDIEYNKKLKPARPALPDEKEAFEIAKALVSANQDRITRDAYFLRKVDLEAPYDPAKLKQSGANWRSNISFGLLSTIIYRVLPALLRAINSTKYITSFDTGSTSKSNILNEKLTKKIRQWKGWQDIIWDSSFENVSLGRAVLAYGDQYDWRPKFYSTSNALLPESCSQNIEEIPFMALLDDWALHEFVDMIKNEEKARGSGWEIENCVKALNDAAPPKREEDKEREYSDWITQGAYGCSVGGAGTDKAKMRRVSTFTVLAQEPDEEGKVSEMMITRDSGKLLYYKKNKYENMSQAAALLTYTRGNGTAHGSKGLCRLLMNYHNTYDQTLNGVINDIFLGSCRTLELPEGKRVNAAIRVQQPFIITPPGAKSQPSNIVVNVDAFNAVTRQIQALSEQTAGAYIPSSLSPVGRSDKTATEATIDAAREAEVKEGVLGRFLYQTQKVITEMSRRLLDPETYDADAKQLQEELEEMGVTREDIKKALENASVDNISDYSGAIRNQKILAFIRATGPGNPAYDQSKLAKLTAEAMVDVMFADDIVIVKPDPMDDVSARNAQQRENAALLGGKIEEITPDPLDNDMVHLAVAAEGAIKFIQRGYPPNTDTLMAIKSMGAHIVAHIEQAKAKGVKEKELKQFEEVLKSLFSTLEKYAKQLEQIGQAVSSQLPQQQPGQAPQLLAGGGGDIPPGPIGASPVGEAGGIPTGGQSSLGTLPA